MAESNVFASGEASPVGVWDLALLLIFAAVLVYWFFLRKPKDEEDIKDFRPKKDPRRIGSFDDTDADVHFVDRMKRKNYRVVVFYGSQTGTAEDFSARLTKDMRRMGVGCTVQDPEDHEMDNLAKLIEIENSLVLFVVATYGEGDPTDNARSLHEWLSSTDIDLSGVRYSAFGLGNKTYEHYNSMGRFVDKKLGELGAERFFRLGEGDDDANIEEDFLVWREQFLEHVRDNFGVTAEQMGQLREYELEVHARKPTYVFVGEPAKIRSFETQRPPFNAKNPYLSPVIVHKELHTGGDRSCMHIELNIAGSKLKYAAGDHVAVQPVNDAAMVEEIGERLSVDLDTFISLNAVEECSPGKFNPFPCPCSYRTALTHYIDLSSRPRTNVLEALLEYCTSDEDKAKIREVTTPGEAGRLAYSEFVITQGRNILDVLKALPSAMPPLDLMLEMLPRLQVRYYSISSSPKMFPDSIHITATTHDYVTTAGRPGSGVATSWMQSLKPKVGTNEARIPVYIRKSTLRLPIRSVVPVIMVGPGTGIAPFRAFIEERHLMKKDGKMVGETRLYFGCRHKAVDFLYQEELESYVEDGSLSLRVAFSRDQEQKVYVSDLLREDAAHVWSMLSTGNSHFYVCGDAKAMARDVNNTLLEITKEHGQKTEEQAQAFIKSLKARGRYVVDAWS